jgi:MoxR-like ATPase
VAFLDEVFKANSAILNALLTLLNEREFDNGAGRVRTPLVCVVGATNEVPQEESLHAFYDRFLLRVPVAPVTDGAFDALIDLRVEGGDAGAAAPLDRDAVLALQQAREAVALADDARAALHVLRAWAAARKVAVSDRRWRQLVQLLRVQAASAGRDRVSLLDLWLVPYVVADQPERVADAHGWWLEHAMAAPPLEAPWLERAVAAFETQLDLETNQQQDEFETGKIALAKTIGATQEEAGMTRLVSEVLEQKLRRRFSPVHVQARLAQLDEIAAPLAPRVQALAAEVAVVEATMREHLWLPPQLRRDLARRWHGALALLQGLQARLAAVREGFAGLPIDAALAGEAAPEPVRLDEAA